MLKKTIATVGGKPVILMDTITNTSAEDAGAIVVSGSHGGVSSGEFALEYPLTAVFFNDAGVGKDRAGVLALDMLEEKGIPAATVSHLSARIGDSADMWDSGVVSQANSTAARVGISIGERLQSAIDHLNRNG